MDTQQLLDALTDHMALYHCRKRQLERRQGHSSSKSDRRKVIEWLKGLSVKQRQIAFTVVDGAWVALILQMQKYLESEGPGVFFVLPDFPSKCPGAVKKQSAGVSNKFQAHGDASLPGLCFRRARGVLKRLAFRKRAEEFLTSSSRLFSSLDGEMSKDSIPNRSLDCLTVSYEFLDNVDEFLEAMDEISYGEFLARQCFSGGSSWEETPWLKSMGYYGLAAFIANRFEFSIWAAWVSALGTKQPSKAIPRTFARNAFEAATIASRVCTKRQGFEEWWNKLSVQDKSKALDCAIGKVSKFEAFKLVARKSRNAAVQVKQLTLRVKDDFSLDHLSNYKNSSLKQEVDRFALVCLGIQFLREVADLRSVTSESNWLVCTPLASVHSSSECILQTVRNILVKVMNHSTEFDLLESGKALAHRGHPCSKTIQPKGRKGKSKKQKRDAIRKSFACVEDQSLQSYRTNQIDGTAGEPQVVEIHCQDSDWIPGKRKKKCKQGKKAKSEAIDACAKQGSEHTSSSCARLASDKSLQDRGVVKQWQMNNKTLLQVGTGDSEAKGSHDTVVTCESGPTRSEEAEPEFQHLTSTAASQGNARPVELALPVGGEDPKITYTTEIANQKTGSNELPSRPPYVKSNQAFRMQQQMPSFVMPISHEWPGAPKSRFSGVDSRGQSAATDWLHLDVSREWQHRLKPPLLAYRPAGRRQNGQVENMMQRSVLSKAATLSWDWPPMVQPGISLASPFGYSVRPKEEPTFISVGPVNMDGLARTGDDVELEEPLPDMDSDDVQGDRDDFVDGCVESDHQTEDVRQFYDMDYNQIFGGGVMYWTSADYTGMGYSRPGSLSSEDSSWARREADLTIVVDDIVGLPPVSAPYPGLSSGASTMTCTSPSSSCSLSFPFDHVAGNGSMFRGEEVGLVAGKADSLSSEHASQPVLPPIAVRESKLSGQASKLEAAKLREARSPHMPRGRRDFVRCKRSPSPVLRCVPPAPPPPPPPSPVGGMKKRRGFATVRSGSSSPRHWGVLSWSDNQDVQFAPEGILSTGWRTRCIPNTPPIHPLTGALLRERLVAIGLEQEHPDVAFPTQTSLLDKNNPTMHTMVARLHKEIEAFCLQVAAENAMRKPFITAAVKKVTHALQVLWPRSRTKIFGSNATGLALPNSDVDLVVCLPPVRNLEPIKEAGILEGRNGIKETCLQHAARYLADQDWVKNDSLKTIENTAIPIIMLVAKSFPDNLLNIHGKGTESDDFQSRPSKHVADSEANVKDEGGQENPPEKGPWGTKEDRHFVRLDISFESPSHTGLLTAELVKELVAQFPAISPLALVLKQFLMDRGLDQPYTGGLSSYCLVLLITRFLQHQHHLGWSSQNQSLGSLLMDFLHFFGCVFDPRRMCISIRGGGMYVNRERLHGIDPLHIEDPLHPTNNVGRNCFRILQCTKAFADAYATLEKELCDTSTEDESVLLQKILPSVLKDR